MTKRFLSVMAMVGIVAMMMLSSCDTANTDSDDNANVSLIGTWEREDEDGLIYTFEFTKDKYITTRKGEYADVIFDDKYEYPIKSINEKEVIAIADGKEHKVYYSDLSRDSVKIQGATYKRVN